MAKKEVAVTSASTHTSYLAALRLIANQSLEIAKLMPHAGERGRIAEEIVKSVLTRTLPRRFSIGTGIVTCATGEVSRQTDIVIYDNFYNSPLLTEFGANIFPVETVYATIEVKSVLDPRGLQSSMDAIMRLRSIGKKRHYAVRVMKIRKGKPKRQIVRHTRTVPPRSYIVAFSQKGLGRSYGEFCEKLRNSLNRDNSHVHGVCVLDRDWFAGRRAYRRPAQLYGDSKDGLLNLYVHILKGQENFVVDPIDLDPYLKQADIHPDF